MELVRVARAIRARARGYCSQTALTLSSTARVLPVPAGPSISTSGAVVTISSAAAPWTR